MSSKSQITFPFENIRGLIFLFPLHFWDIMWLFFPFLKNTWLTYSCVPHSWLPFYSISSEKVLCFKIKTIFFLNQNCAYYVYLENGRKTDTLPFWHWCYYFTNYIITFSDIIHAPFMLIQKIHAFVLKFFNISGRMVETYVLAEVGTC